MLPTSTDRDRRRLAVAVIAAVAVHGIAFGLIALVPGWHDAGRGWFRANGGAGSISSPGGGDSSRSGRGTETLPVYVSLADGKELDDERSDPSPPSPVQTPDKSRVQSSESRAGGNEPSASGEGSGTGISPGAGDGDGDGDGVGEAKGSANRRFVAWLDGAIRARLRYPERARARNAEGTVVVALSVPANGKTCNATIAESSGDGTLDRAALALVKSLFPAQVAPQSDFSAPVRIRFALEPPP